jgi:hypothetical protein
MKCKDCDLEVERGLFAKIGHLSKCKGNVSVYNGKISAKEIEAFFDYSSKRQREYRCTTIYDRLQVFDEVDKLLVNKDIVSFDHHN